MTGQSPSAQVPAGWYQAKGDPAESERFWDGASWQGQPRPKAPASPEIQPPPPEPPQAEQTLDPEPLQAAGVMAAAQEQPTPRRVSMPAKIWSDATALSIAMFVLLAVAIGSLSTIRSSIAANPYARGPRVVSIDTYAQLHAPSYLRTVTVVTVLLGVLILAQLCMALYRNVFGLLITASIISALDIVNVLTLLKQSSFGAIGLVHLLVAVLLTGLQIKLALWAYSVHQLNQTVSSKISRESASANIGV